MSTQRDGIDKAEALAAKGKYKRALALYLKAGDHHGAAEMHERLGQVDLAVAEYTRGGEFTRAAELLASAKRFEEAAQMFAKAQAFERAADLLVTADKLTDAARMYERAGALRRAAEIYEQSGKIDTAARLYEKAGDREAAIRVYHDHGRKDLAAKLCAVGGDHARAAEMFEGIGMHLEAAECYVNADMKSRAVESYERAGAVADAIKLCEELSLHDKAGAYHEQLGNKRRAAECYREAGMYAAAGRLYESEHQYYEAAKMYEHDEATVAYAAKLFHSTYSTDLAWEFPTKLPVWDLAVAPKARRLVAGLGGPEFLLLDTDGSLVWQFRIPMGVRCRSVAISSDGGRIALGTEGRSVYLLDQTKKLMWKRDLGGEVRGVAFAEKSNLVLAASTDGHLKAMTADGKDVWTFQAEYKLWRLHAHEDRGQVLVGSGDGNLYLIDFAGDVAWKENTGDWVSRASISPDGHYAVAVIGQGKLNLYDLERRELLWQYEDEGILQDAAFWRAERLLVGANTGAFILDFDRQVLWRNPAEDRVMRIVTGDDGQSIFLGQFEKGLTAIRLNDCLLRAAHNYTRAGMYAEAAALYESKNELSGAMDLYAKLKEYGKAAALAERLGHFEQAGDLYERGGMYAEAGACFEKVNMIERAAACYDAAGQRSKAGKLLAGLGDTVKAAELHVQSGDWVAAGALFEQAGALRDAQLAYEKASEAGVLTAKGAVSLGRIYFMNERLDEAIKLLQPIRRDAEHGRDAAKVLAECFMRKGLHNVAVDYFREALAGHEEASAENLDTLYGLGCAYEQAGMYDKAREVFQSILVVDYYYRDVTGRLEHINEMSSIFTPSFAAQAGAGPTSTAPRGAQATVAVAKKSRYEILRKLGEGGMGVVYQARDTKLDRIVALKVLPSRLSNDDEFRTRFVREARAVAALSHKNVIAVYDIGEEWGESYIAMEFIEGKILRDILNSKTKFTPEEALRLGRQIAEGLGAAHKRGIIHRDIKPENIMVTNESGEVKIMDFGLARMDAASNLTQEGSIMGTWRYMAPEMITGQRATAAVDVYAVGVMLFEMLTGNPPFPEGDLAYHHVNTPPPNVSEVAPNTPVGLAEVVMRCLAKDPAARYADGNELLAALEAISAA